MSVALLFPQGTFARKESERYPCTSGYRRGRVAFLGQKMRTEAGFCVEENARVDQNNAFLQV